MSGQLNLSLSWILFPFKTPSGMTEKPLMSNVGWVWNLTKFCTPFLLWFFGDAALSGKLGWEIVTPRIGYSTHNREHFEWLTEYGNKQKVKSGYKSGNPRRGENIDLGYVWQIQAKIFTLIKNIINTIVCVVSRWKSGRTIIQVDVGEEKIEASFLLSLPLGPLSAPPHWPMQKPPSLFYIKKNTLRSSRENFKLRISHFRFRFTSKKWV
jgi:hypothetical protein